MSFTDPRTILHISPRLPPAVSGVGDYAALLAQALVPHGISSSFVSLDPPDTVLGKANVISITHRNPRNVAELLQSKRPDAVLLHYSNYGYDQRGVCFWLADALRLWKGHAPYAQLVTIFHEVFASGPFWRSSFWTTGSQRFIAQQVATLSDVIFTTSAYGAGQLQGVLPHVKTSVLPVFSNVGECINPMPLSQRDTKAVVFGSEETRNRFYRTTRRISGTLSKLFASLKLSEIIDIGPGKPIIGRVAGFDIRPVGPLAPQDVSVVLNRSAVGLINYPHHVMTKSGVAAAYLAHGILMVNSSATAGPTSGMLPGREFIVCTPQQVQLEDLEYVARRGFSWYSRHCLSNTAKRIARTIL